MEQGGSAPLIKVLQEAFEVHPNRSISVKQGQWYVGPVKNQEWFGDLKDFEALKNAENQTVKTKTAKSK